MEIERSVRRCSIPSEVWSVAYNRHKETKPPHQKKKKEYLGASMESNSSVVVFIVDFVIKIFGSNRNAKVIVP